MGKGVISHYTRSCDSCTRGEVGNWQGGRMGGKGEGSRIERTDGGREEA